MKKTSALLLISLILSSFLWPGLPVQAKESGFLPSTSTEISAEAVYLYNLDTETLIYEKNAEDSRAPASLTKIMTAILALESTDNLDTELVTYPQYVQDELYTYQIEHNVTISNGELRAGDILPMREYLYALMLPSANEAALTIADHLARKHADFKEGVDNPQVFFVGLMNQRAKELSATSTNFINPNGLHAEGHVSSAKDMALFTLHAMTLPHFMDIVSTTQYEATPTNRDITLVWDTTVAMQVSNEDSYVGTDIKYYYPGLKGVKTGTLTESGRCFVSTASRDGFHYLLVVMGSPFEAFGLQTAFWDAKELYNWAFRDIKYRSLIPQDAVLTEVPVTLSEEKDYVQLVAAEHFSYLMPTDIQSEAITLIHDTPKSLEAPVEAGTVVGTTTLMLDGKEIGAVTLVTKDSIEASQYLIFMEKLKAVVETFWFKFAVILVVLLLVVYLVFMFIRNKNRRRRRPAAPRRPSSRKRR